MDDDEAMAADDWLDPELADRFDALMRVPAPDIWDQVVVLAPAPARRGPGPRVLAAAALVLAALGIAALVRLVSDGEGTTNLATQDATQDTATQPGPVVDGDDGGPVASQRCDVGGLADSLGQGLPTVDYEPWDSLQELAAASPRVVRGRLLSAVAAEGGTMLDIDVIEAVGEGGRSRLPASVWTPATQPPAGPLGGEVVAFLTGEVVGDQQAWIVDVEGLWVGCDAFSPARSVIVEPTAPGWDASASGVTLEELWLAASWPEGERTSVLEAPALVEGDAAVYDVRLSDGSRFRLSIPEELAERFDVRERPTPAPVVIEGERSTITVSYQSCDHQEDMTENALGSLVDIRAGAVRICRPDEALVTHIETVTTFEPGVADLFDLRAVELGWDYAQALESAWPTVSSCPFCSPFGPLELRAENVVVHTAGAGSVTAVDLDSLATVWTVVPGGAETYLQGGDPVGLYISVPGGFLRLDPATGEEVWRIDRSPNEGDVQLSGHAGELWLLWSSFPSAGDDQAPLLRRIEPARGQVLWTATGREGTDWQPTWPVVLEGVAVMMDVPVNPQVPLSPSGATLRAYDIESGALAWTTDLASPTEAFETQLVTVADLEDGPALVVRTLDDAVLRVDPGSGEILWRRDAAGAEVGGTDRGPDGSLAIVLALGDGGRLLLDPGTGDIVARTDPPAAFECPVTVPQRPGFVPPAPWPAAPSEPNTVWFGTEELWTVMDLDGRAPRKSVWWSADFPGGSEEPRPPIEVVYQRLDVEAPPIIFPAPGTNAAAEDGRFMINGIEPMEPGCWRATATYKDATLGYVYEVG